MRKIAILLIYFTLLASFPASAGVISFQQAKAAKEPQTWSELVAHSTLGAGVARLLDYSEIKRTILALRDYLQVVRGHPAEEAYREANLALKAQLLRAFPLVPYEELQETPETLRAKSVLIRSQVEMTVPFMSLDMIAARYSEEGADSVYTTPLLKFMAFSLIYKKEFSESEQVELSRVYPQFLKALGKQVRGFANDLQIATDIYPGMIGSVLSSNTPQHLQDYGPLMVPASQPSQAKGLARLTADVCDTITMTVHAARKICEGNIASPPATDSAGEASNLLALQMMFEVTAPRCNLW